MMDKISRRQALVLGASVAAASMLPATLAFASKTDDAIAKFTGGKSVEEGKVTLDLPEIAENGNTVPLSISVESPMTGDDYVKRVIILAEGNPNPGVATFNFTPRSGVAEASTRMRLAKTQNVIAVAETSTGKFYMAKRQVKVTIGGCGG